MRNRLFLLILPIIFLIGGCKTASIPEGFSLEGNWVVEATYEKGNPRVYSIGQTDKKKFQIIKENGQYKVVNYGYLYSANPEYVFESGSIEILPGIFKVKGIIKGKSNSRDIILRFVGQVPEQSENGEKIIGKFKITYKINGHDVNGSGSCIVYKDNDTAIPELIASINGKDLNKVKELIKDPKILNYLYYHDKNLLMIQIAEKNWPLASLLIESGIDLNHQDWFQTTALMYALESNNSDIAEALVDRGCNVETLNQNGWSPLLYALFYTQDEKICLKLIEKGANILIKDREDWTPLMMALRYGKPNVANALIQRYNKDSLNLTNVDGWSALMMAIRYRQSTNAHLLISKGAFINQKSKAGWTPLMLACLDNDITIAKELLENGADIDSRNDEGKTATDIAKANSPVFYFLLVNYKDIKH
jgi:ankyrin repeat protein